MENNQLLHELNACAIVSNMCYNSCLNGEQVTSRIRCIELCRECADICQLTSSMMSRESKETDGFLKLCVKIMLDCAAECEKHDDEHCQKCARVCYKCAEMCNTYQPEFAKHF